MLIRKSKLWIGIWLDLAISIESKMSDKNDEKSAASDIPRVLVDGKRGESYQRLRFFGKVSPHRTDRLSIFSFTDRSRKIFARNESVRFPDDKVKMYCRLNWISTLIVMQRKIRVSIESFFDKRTMQKRKKNMVASVSVCTFSIQQTVIIQCRDVFIVHFPLLLLRRRRRALTSLWIRLFR